MPEKKDIEFQILEMQQNKEDLNRFVRDLDSWENEMKTKDEQLRTGNLAGIQNFPAVRNKDYKKKSKKKCVSNGDTKTEDIKKAPRITDYSSWDKFDADEALAVIDKDAVSNDSDLEDPTIDRKKALSEKEMGNKLFKEGKLDDAIKCYTNGLLATQDNVPRRTIPSINKPPHLQSTKPLRRIVIEEVSGKISVPKAEEASGVLPAGPQNHGVVKEGEGLPVSIAPSTKMLKIEELSDIPEWSPFIEEIADTPARRSPLIEEIGDIPARPTLIEEIGDIPAPPALIEEIADVPAQSPVILLPDQDNIGGQEKAKMEPI